MMSNSYHRDFLGAHRYTTGGGMCVLRRPLHGAGRLSPIVVRGNYISPSLRYPLVHFASETGLKSRPVPSTKPVDGIPTGSCACRATVSRAYAATERRWCDGS